MVSQAQLRSETRQQRVVRTQQERVQQAQEAKARAEYERQVEEYERQVAEEQARVDAANEKEQARVNEANRKARLDREAYKKAYEHTTKGGALSGDYDPYFKERYKVYRGQIHSQVYAASLAGQYVAEKQYERKVSQPGYTFSQVEDGKVVTYTDVEYDPKTKTTTAKIAGTGGGITPYEPYEPLGDIEAKQKAADVIRTGKFEGAKAELYFTPEGAEIREKVEIKEPKGVKAIGYGAGKAFAGIYPSIVDVTKKYGPDIVETVTTQTKKVLAPAWNLGTTTVKLAKDSGAVDFFVGGIKNIDISQDLKKAEIGAKVLWGATKEYGPKVLETIKSESEKVIKRVKDVSEFVSPYVEKGIDYAGAGIKYVEPYIRPVIKEAKQKVELGLGVTGAAVTYLAPKAEKALPYVRTAAKETWKWGTGPIIGLGIDTAQRGKRYEEEVLQPITLRFKEQEKRIAEAKTYEEQVRLMKQYEYAGGRIKTIITPSFR